MNPTPDRKLTRSRDDRVIGGVAAGIAGRLGIDPTIVRIAFVGSLVFGGLGLIVYLVLLATLKVEDGTDEPLPPVSPGRRGLAVAVTLLAGLAALVAIRAGDFAGWLFGFGPGTLFGILFWIAVGCGAIWLLASGGLREAGPGRSAAAPGPDDPGPDVAVLPAKAETHADSPTQVIPAEVTATEVIPAGDDPTEVIPAGDEPTGAMALRPGRAGSGGGQNREPDRRPPEADPGDDPDRGGPTVIGQIMTWFALGLAGFTLFLLIAPVSGATTAVAGGLPMGIVTVLLGAATVFAGIRGRPIAAGFLAVAAIAVVIPLAVVTAADLRIRGGYGDIRESPRSLTDIPRDGYELAAGGMTIDLRRFDPGRRPARIPVRSGFGLTSVIVPDGTCVIGSVHGRAGVATFRGRERNGLDLTLDRRTAGRSAPVLVLDGDFKLGAFEVVDASQWRQSGRGGSFDDVGTARERRALDRSLAACSGPDSRQPAAGGKRQRR